MNLNRVENLPLQLPVVHGELQGAALAFGSAAAVVASKICR